jgi:hypothetical protein
VGIKVKIFFIFYVLKQELEKIALALALATVGI